MKRVTAIVLAAGRSTRMAPVHKLLEPLGVRSVLGTTLCVLRASSVDEILVVLGHEAGLVGAEVARTLAGVRLIHAERYAEGLSATLSAGVSAVSADTDGALIVLGDMPLVRSETIDRLLTRFRASGPAAPIILPVHGGRRGNPVLWDRAHLPALAALDGDAGGRFLLDMRAAAVDALDVDDPAVLADIDTPEALAEARVLLSAAGW